MTTAAYGIENTLPFYPALDGTPLSLGSVWFGVAGQNPVTNPVSIYSDAAATQPISQPVSISNGRTVDSAGNPISIYIAGDFSRLVQDNQGRQLLYQASQPPTLSASQAQNWAQQTGADVSGAPAGSRSAKSWAQDGLSGATYGGSAKDWAQSASLPDGVNKSAKSYATDAQSWAQSASLPDGTNKSAKSYATDAQSSANAAFASAHIYANPSGGVDPTTGVASGQLYLVSGADLYTFSVYLNNAGTPSLQGTMYMPDGTVFTKNTRGSLQEMQTSGGATHTATVPDGTVLSKLRPKTLDAPSTTTIGGKSISTLIQQDQQTTARKELSLWIDRALARTEASTYAVTTPVISNTIDSTTYTETRFGTVQMCLDGTTILVFACPSYNSGDFGVGDLVVKRVTYNKTTRALTLGSLVVLGNGNVDPDGAANPGRWGSPCTVLITQGANRGRVFLMYYWENTAGTSFRLHTRYTDDNGATWSSPVEITSQFDMANYVILTMGPAPGLQITKGAYAGRMVMPAWHSCPGYPNSPTDSELTPDFDQSVLLYSDDHGVTWSVGAKAPREQVVDSNECAVAEDLYGDLLWAIRTTTYTNGKALLKVSGGGTVLDGTVYQMVDGVGTAIVTSQVMCGLTQCVAVNPLKSSAPKFLLTLPNSTVREKVTIYASYDGGATWPFAYQLSSGDGAYSTPICLDDRTLAVYWENGGYSEMRITVLNLLTLLGA